MDGTNTMSGERSGLQRRFRHEVPHSKYVNCRNHKLALVFVHLLPNFKPLQNVDSVLLSSWKMMKYSTVKNAVFGEAQETFGKKRRKLLKAAATRWLSHDKASKRLVSRYSCLIDALDAILEKGANQEVKGLRDELLNPKTALFLLLLTDVLSFINRFSLFLQKKNLIFADIASKFNVLKNSISELMINDGSYFKEYSKSFLRISGERMELARRLRGHNLIEVTECNVIEEKINNFNRTVKVPFLEEVLKELYLAFSLDDPVFLAFDAFNVSSDFDLETREQFVKVLSEFYGVRKSSTFNGETNTSEPIIDKLGLSKDEIRLFFPDFNAEVRREQHKRNEQIRKLIENKKLQPNEVAQYKEDHPINPSVVYKSLIKERSQYPELMTLFKFSLLITPSTANVERGFSVLGLLATKQRNSLSPSTLDKLMRIVLLGPEKFDDNTWETLVDRYRDMSDRRIDL